MTVDELIKLLTEIRDENTAFAAALVYLDYDNETGEKFMQPLRSLTIVSRPHKMVREIQFES